MVLQTMWIRLIVQEGFDLSETKIKINKVFLFTTESYREPWELFIMKNASQQNVSFCAVFSWHLQLVRTQVITDILASFMKSKQNGFQCVVYKTVELCSDFVFLPKKKCSSFRAIWMKLIVQNGCKTQN